MPSQNNFIRPSTAYSASSTMKLDPTEVARRKKTSVVILTLLSLIIFLFILCKFNGNLFIKFQNVLASLLFTFCFLQNHRQLSKA